MLQIYTVPVATYCAKLRVMMRHKSLVWEELVPPGGYGSDEYRSIVPSGNLPAMIHDGFMLADSEAIAEYLNEAFPNVPMLPEDMRHRAKAREFGRLHDTRLEPAVRSLYPHVDFHTRDPAAVETIGLTISKSLEALALLLASNPLDVSRLWLCDCGFAITFAWIRAFESAIGLRVEWPQSVIRYRARLEEFPAVNDELADYKPAMDSYLEKAKAQS